MTVLPPGTLLQLMYLADRLRELPPGRFIEIGPGSGEITQLLLDRGWQGRSYDLESRTVAKLRVRFDRQIQEQRFAAINQDFLSSDLSEMDKGKADLVISCMVMEHLDDSAEARFMRAASQALKSSGLMIGLVPGSPAHWGIEDDIAGHCRRYTQSGVQQLASSNRWKLMHIAGLTYPLSNMLLPVSNLLVRRSESGKLSMSALERTKESGRRSVKFKTTFPVALAMILNRVTLLPMHLLQKVFLHSERALVIYFEAKPPMKTSHG